MPSNLGLNLEPILNSWSMPLNSLKVLLNGFEIKFKILLVLTHCEKYLYYKAYSVSVGLSVRFFENCPSLNVSSNPKGERGPPEAAL